MSSFNLVTLSKYLTKVHSANGNPTTTAPPRKILDLRPKPDYEHRHLYRSVNLLELEFSDSKFCQLPAKAIALDVLVPFEAPRPANSQDVIPPADRPWIKLALWLFERGWQVENVVPVQGSYIDATASTMSQASLPVSATEDPGWHVARELGVLVEDGRLPSGQVDAGHHVLFDPCPPLAQHIDAIERALLTALQSTTHTGKNENDTGSTANRTNDMAPKASAAAIPANQPNSTVDRPRLTVCDLGCGSGRDLAWLCSRHLRSPLTHTPDESNESLSERASPQWVGLGIDTVAKALCRARILFTQLGVSDNVILCHGKFHQESPLSLKSPLSNPALANTWPSPTKPQPSAVPTPLPYAAHPYSGLRDLEGVMHQTFDLVVCIRFLNRWLFSSGQLDRWIKPGGFLLYCTFVETKEFPGEHPTDPKHRVQPGELAKWLGPDTGYDIWYDEIETIEDGRHVNSFVARKRMVELAVSP